MSAPKHLWSGDWERDSEALADELAGSAVARPPREPDAEPPALSTTRAAQPRLPSHVRADPRPAAAPRRSIGARLIATVLACVRGVWALLAGTVRLLVRLLRAPRLRTRAALITILVAAVIVGAALALGAGGSGNTSGAQQAATNGGAVMWLGMQIDQTQSGGAVVSTVANGSEGAAIGLDPGDMITQIGAQQIDSTASLRATLSRIPIGSHFTITVARGTATYSTLATLTSRPTRYP